MDQAIQSIQSDIASVDAKLKELKQLLNTETDPQMRALTEEEIKSLESQLTDLSKALNAIQNPQGPQTETSSAEHGIDPNSAILEVRAGTGGDEAGLFAGELLKMYTRYCDRMGFKVSEISKTEGMKGEIRTASVELKGSNIYHLLKNESGVHRVQRIPVTESGGRIHTSTATVAILPVVSPVEVEINPKDIEVGFFHSGGHGGQNVNKVETAVRVKHLPTGLVVESQEQRTQGQNKEKALQVLRSRLFELMQQQQKSKVDELRSDQIGSGERSEKIRTYNFPQDRVTDHRVKQTWHNIPALLNGEIEEILTTLSQAEDLSIKDA